MISIAKFFLASAIAFALIRGAIYITVGVPTMTRAAGAIFDCVTILSALAIGYFVCRWLKKK